MSNCIKFKGALKKSLLHSPVSVLYSLRNVTLSLKSVSFHFISFHLKNYYKRIDSSHRVTNAAKLGEAPSLSSVSKVENGMLVQREQLEADVAVSVLIE